MQLTLERSEGSGAGPKAVENPRITFDSPKTQVVPWHLWVIGSRTSTDTESHRCSSTLYKMTRISAYGWPSTPADLQPQVKKVRYSPKKHPCPSGPAQIKLWCSQVSSISHAYPGVGITVSGLPAPAVLGFLGLTLTQPQPGPSVRRDRVTHSSSPGMLGLRILGRGRETVPGWQPTPPPLALSPAGSFKCISPLTAENVRQPQTRRSPETEMPFAKRTTLEFFWASPSL